MTTSGGIIVRLSAGDWVRIGAATSTIVMVLAGGYIRQDRMLSELMALTKQQNERIIRLENQMDLIRRTP